MILPLFFHSVQSLGRFGSLACFLLGLAIVVVVASLGSSMKHLVSLFNTLYYLALVAGILCMVFGAFGVLSSCVCLSRRVPCCLTTVALVYGVVALACIIILILVFTLSAKIVSTATSTLSQQCGGEGETDYSAISKSVTLTSECHELIPELKSFFCNDSNLISPCVGDSEETADDSDKRLTQTPRDTQPLFLTMPNTESYNCSCAQFNTGMSTALLVMLINDNFALFLADFRFLVAVVLIIIIVVAVLLVAIFAFLRKNIRTLVPESTPEPTQTKRRVSGSESSTHASVRHPPQHRREIEMEPTLSPVPLTVPMGMPLQSLPPEMAAQSPEMLLMQQSMLMQPPPPKKSKNRQISVRNPPSDADMLAQQEMQQMEAYRRATMGYVMTQGFMGYPW